MFGGAYIFEACCVENSIFALILSCIRLLLFLCNIAANGTSVVSSNCWHVSMYCSFPSSITLHCGGTSKYDSRHSLALMEARQVRQPVPPTAIHRALRSGRRSTSCATIYVLSPAELRSQMDRCCCRIRSESRISRQAVVESCR